MGSLAWPPEKYLVTLTCRGIARIDSDNEPVPSDHHQFSMYLAADYPGVEPTLVWLTDIWHPNIEKPHVCTNAAENFFGSMSAAEVVLTLAKMVQYRHYHAKLSDPWPLDHEAAKWVREYAEPKGIVGPNKPYDDRQLLWKFDIDFGAAERRKNPQTSPKRSQASDSPKMADEDELELGECVPLAVSEDDLAMELGDPERQP